MDSTFKAKMDAHIEKINKMSVEERLKLHYESQAKLSKIPHGNYYRGLKYLQR